MMIKLRCLVLIALSFALLSCSKKQNAHSRVEIIFSANLNGNIEACHCGEVMLGGLQNTAVIIDSLRNENPEVIVIDGGDTFNYYPFPALNNAVAASYKVIKPDIWVLGEQDFIEGNSFLSEHIKSPSIEIITGNYKIENITSISKKNYTISDINLTITSYLQPGLLEDDLYLDKQDQFNSMLNNLNQEDFNILVLHADSDEFGKHKNEFSKFDLILTAHQQSAVIDTESRPAFIDGHSDGEVLLHIKVSRIENDYSINCSLLPVYISNNPNMEIDNFIKDYKSTLINKD